MIKSNMSNMPIYYMSMFKMPAAVANRLEKIQRRFLWGDSEGRRKIHLLSWDRITRSKKYGGLGIKRLLEHNVALLAKWWWRFNKEKEALWVKVVSKKYGLKEDEWLPQLPVRGKPSNIWKDICLVGSVAADMGECIIRGFTFNVTLEIASNFGNINGWERKL